MLVWVLTLTWPFSNPDPNQAGLLVPALCPHTPLLKTTRASCAQPRAPGSKVSGEAGQEGGWVWGDSGARPLIRRQSCLTSHHNHPRPSITPAPMRRGRGARGQAWGQERRGRPAPTCSLMPCWKGASSASCPCSVASACSAAATLLLRAHRMSSGSPASSSSAALAGLGLPPSALSLA